MGYLVIAGSFNLSRCDRRANSSGGTDTTLAKIIAAVESAQTRKAEVQKIADRVRVICLRSHDNCPNCTASFGIFGELGSFQRC
jgi:cation transport ATPase